MNVTRQNTSGLNATIFEIVFESALIKPDLNDPVLRRIFFETTVFVTLRLHVEHYGDAKARFSHLALTGDRRRLRVPVFEKQCCASAIGYSLTPCDVRCRKAYMQIEQYAQCTRCMDIMAPLYLP